MLVKYSRANIHSAYGMRFFPGMNDVDPEKFELAKADPQIQNFLDSGVMEVIESGSKTPGEKVETLEEFNEKSATSIVKATYSLDMLKGWKYGEKRVKVLKAIDAQIADIEAAMAKKDGAK